MKRILSILAVIVGIAGLLAGVYWLLVLRPISNNNAHAQNLILYNRIKGQINQLVGKLDTASTQDIYQAALLTVDRKRQYLSQDEITALNNSIAPAMIRCLDSLVSRQYGPDMRTGDISRLPRLKSYFEGVAFLKAAAPAIAASQGVKHVQNLEKTHKDIYAFGQKRYGLSPRINPSFTSDYRIRFSSAANVAAYRQQAYNARQALASRRNAMPDLMRVDWPASVLRETVLNDKLNLATTAYGNAERRIVYNFLNSLPSRVSAGRPSGGYTTAQTNALCADIDRLNNALANVPGNNPQNAPNIYNLKEQLRRLMAEK